MSKRLLVAEDEPFIAMTLEDDLSHRGYDVVVVRDGPSALRAARDDTFDVVVLDVMLPKQDGFAVCRELRALGVTTPILMLTAKAEEADIVRGLSTGADDYVVKPYRPPELCARIEALLRRSNSTVGELYRFSDVEVDFVRREVRRAGVPVPLTPLEFRLLDTFIRHRGRALRRETLIAEAWGAATFVTSRVVDTQVTNLRKKIERDLDAPQVIQSVRGFGYRFDG